MNMKPIHLISAGCTILSLFSLHPAAAQPSTDEASTVMATLAYGPENILRDTDYQMKVSVLVLPEDKASLLADANAEQIPLTPKEAKLLKRYARHSAEIPVRDRLYFQDEDDRLRGSFRLDPIYLDEANIRCVTVESGCAFLGAGRMKKGETVLLRNRGKNPEGNHICLLVSFTLPDDDD